jgi:FkbM family methyltransferase
MFLNVAKNIYGIMPFKWLRKLAFNIYSKLVSNKRVTTIRDGVYFNFNLGELIELALYLDKFEPKVVKYINEKTKKGMVVLDIGANIGAHTLRLAKLAGKNGMVYAFEPTKYAFKKLQNNMSLNQDLSIKEFRVALSDFNAKNKEIAYRSSWRTDGTFMDTSCKVDFIKLDDFILNNNIKRVDLIKIDVDGNEFGVLNGGVEMLKRDRPNLIMELVGLHLQNDSKNPYKLLNDLGYRFINIDNGDSYKFSSELKSIIDINDMEMKTSINIFSYFDS